MGTTSFTLWHRNYEHTYYELLLKDVPMTAKYLRPLEFKRLQDALKNSTLAAL